MNIVAVPIGNPSGQQSIVVEGNSELRSVVVVERPSQRAADISDVDPMRASKTWERNNLQLGASYSPTGIPDLPVDWPAVDRVY